jgi:hypothetical protein
MAASTPLSEVPTDTLIKELLARECTIAADLDFSDTHELVSALLKRFDSALVIAERWHAPPSQAPVLFAAHGPGSSVIGLLHYAAAILDGQVNLGASSPSDEADPSEHDPLRPPP